MGRLVEKTAGHFHFDAIEQRAAEHEVCDHAGGLFFRRLQNPVTGVVEPSQMQPAIGFPHVV